jgi:uncharacterized membrane protein
MSEQNTQTIVVKQTKSLAPLICGVIGFIVGIPAILCATICAAACAAGKAAMENSDTISLPASFWIFVLCWLAGFVLCFFAKSEKSKLTGALTLAAGVIIAIAMVLVANLFGIAAGILYIVSGFLAIANASRPAA